MIFLSKLGYKYCFSQLENKYAETFVCDDINYNVIQSCIESLEYKIEKLKPQTSQNNATIEDIEHTLMDIYIYNDIVHMHYSIH